MVACLPGRQQSCLFRKTRSFISNGVMSGVNSGISGHLDHAEDQIYNSAPRLTLSARILHASVTTAALADEWLRARIHQQPARTASAATFSRAASVLHKLTFSGSHPRQEAGVSVSIFMGGDAQKAIQVNNLAPPADVCLQNCNNTQRLRAYYGRPQARFHAYACGVTQSVALIDICNVNATQTWWESLDCI